MESVLIFLLLSAIAFFTYNYFIYPAAIIMVSKILKSENEIKNQDIVYPSVSIIIAAYNEEKVILQKIKNTLSLDYPCDKLQVIVVSDGSDDNTQEIVNKFSSDEFLSLHQKERNGKSAALNRGVEVASGDILVFSDANNDFCSDAIQQLIKHFDNPETGAVSGAKHIYANDKRQAATGDGLYWRYESKIKQAESDLGSITGAEGEILALRKNLFKPIDRKKINDDAAITFDVIKSGYRVLYEKNAKAYEEASKNLIEDYNVKVRMTAGGYQTVSYEKKYLFPPLNWFSFTFISHKLLRWLAPHFLLIIFIVPAILIYRKEMLFLFLIQVIFYSISFFGWLNRDKKLPGFIYIPMYFTIMNIALFWGFIRYMKKETASIWTKADR